MSCVLISRRPGVARFVWLIAAALLAGPGLTVDARAQAVSSTDIAKAAGVAMTQLQAQLALVARQLAVLQATYSAAMWRWDQCRPGGSKYGTSDCSAGQANGAKAEADRAWAELQAILAEQREREAVLAAMRRIAAELVYADVIASLLGGKADSLGAIPGLDAFKPAVDQSLTVDRAALTLRFRTGRLAHCFSPRSVCDAKPYAVRK